MFQEHTGTVYAANFNDEMNVLLSQMFIIFGMQGRMTEWDMPLNFLLFLLARDNDWMRYAL